MGPAAAGSELASRERGAGCAAGSRPVAPAGRIVPARKKRGAGTARPLPAIGEVVGTDLDCLYQREFS